MQKPDLKDLTLREKIGQTVCFNQALLKEFKTEEEIREYFKNNPVGSTWTWVHDINYYLPIEKNRGNEKLEGYSDDMNINFINVINECMKIPVMVGIDAPQGIPKENIEGHEPLPVAPALGATQSEELAYEYGKALAEDLKSIGVRWLWSPTADNAGISRDLRHLCADPELSGKMLAAFTKGLQDNGVCGGAKHFPGCDPYEYRDSHFCVSSYSQSFETWLETQAKGFQACIDAGIGSFMIGHKTFKAVDDTRINDVLLPSVLSYKVITELLKGKMGFKGVCITDDIDMKAANTIYPPEKLYVEALKAGNDIIEGPPRLDYIDIVEKAVLSGELSEERINDACQRVLDMKERFGIFDLKEIPHPTEAQREAIRHENKRVTKQIVEKSLTLTANRTNFLPINKKDIKKVKIIYIGYSDECFENLKYIKDEFAKRGATCDIQEGIKKTDLPTLPDYDLIIYATYIGFHAPSGGAYFFGEKCEMMWDVMVSAPEKSVGVSFGDMYIYFNYFTAAHSFVNAYSYGEETMRGFTRALYGEIEFTKFSPFPLNPITRTDDVY